MFDFSFGELLVVALVALVVLGPERLPKAARFTGLWVRRARAQWYSVKSELEHELASDELKRSLHDARQAMQDTEQHLRGFAGDTRREIEADIDPSPATHRAGDAQSDGEGDGDGNVRSDTPRGPRDD